MKKQWLAYPRPTIALSATPLRFPGLLWAMLWMAGSGMVQDADAAGTQSASSKVGVQVETAPVSQMAGSRMSSEVAMQNGLSDTTTPWDSRPPAPPLDSLLQWGFQHSPGLAAAQARIDWAMAGERRARAYAPPEIAVETGRKTIGMMEDPQSMSMTGVVVRQMFMNPGELSAMGDAEKARASMKLHAKDGERQSLARDIRKLYWDLYMLQGQWKVNRDHLRFVERGIEVVRRNYEVGMGRMGDILRAQTEVARLRSEALNLEQRHEGMEAMLESKLGMPLRPRFGWISEPDGFSGPLPPEDSLIAWGSRLRPEIASMAANVEMAKKESLATKRSRYGNAMVEGKWMAMQGPDEWSIMAGITVPLAPWSRGESDGRREAAAAKVLEAEAKLQEMKNEVRAQIREALSAVQTARRLLALAEKVTIPQADQNLASAEASYRAGKMEFMMLLDAYHLAHMAHEERYMAMAKERQGWADLENAVGASSPAWPARMAQGGKE